MGKRCTRHQLGHTQPTLLQISLTNPSKLLKTNRKPILLHWRYAHTACAMCCESAERHFPASRTIISLALSSMSKQLSTRAAGKYCRHLAARPFKEGCGWGGGNQALPDHGGNSRLPPNPNSSPRQQSPTRGSSVLHLLNSECKSEYTHWSHQCFKQCSLIPRRLWHLPRTHRVQQKLFHAVLPGTGVA